MKRKSNDTPNSLSLLEAVQALSQTARMLYVEAFYIRVATEKKIAQIKHSKTQADQFKPVSQYTPARSILLNNTSRIAS